MTLPHLGSWVRWVTSDFGREGQVVAVDPPSMVVKWLGIDQPQVFPLATPYFVRGHDQMEVIPEPPKAAQIDRQMAKGHMGVAAAAAALGITEKRVRQRLRSGTLGGEYKDGRWTKVWVVEG